MQNPLPTPEFLSVLHAELERLGSDRAAVSAQLSQLQTALSLTDGRILALSQLIEAYGTPVGLPTPAAPPVDPEPESVELTVEDGVIGRLDHVVDPVDLVRLPRAKRAPSEDEAAVERFLQERQVSRCPAAFVGASSAVLSPEDRAALVAHQERQQQAERRKSTWQRRPKTAG